MAPELSEFRDTVVVTGIGLLKAEIADATSEMALLAPPCVNVIVKVTFGCSVFGVCSNCRPRLPDICRASIASVSSVPQI